MAATTEIRVPQKKAKVFLVDDHPVVLQGLEQLINQQEDLIVCGQASDSPGALKAIEALKPNLAIVDISLKSGSGLDLIKSLRQGFPKLPVLVLSMHDESLYAERVLRAGARGYISKQEATEKLITAIRRVLDGDIYLNEKVTSKILSRVISTSPAKNLSPVNGLSDRELEVFQMIGQGHGTREIAEMLHLSIKTVETYREHIKEKLKLSNAMELVHHAIRWAKSEEKI